MRPLTLLCFSSNSLPANFERSRSVFYLRNIADPVLPISGLVSRNRVINVLGVLSVSLKVSEGRRGGGKEGRKRKREKGLVRKAICEDYRVAICICFRIIFLCPYVQLLCQSGERAALKKKKKKRIFRFIGSFIFAGREILLGKLLLSFFFSF